MGSITKPSLDIHTTLSNDGFVVIPQLLSPSSLETLRKAASNTITLAQQGKWPHLRTMPKQFPPWATDPSPGIWGIQHIMHPDLPSHKTFAENYFGDQLISIVTQIMDCKPDELIMELYNMLIGTPADFALTWHRDDIKSTASVAEEEARLCRDKDAKRSYSHAQWNIALYDDAALVVVPGSHRRARTEVERAATPYEKELPDMRVVELKAGDAVFYDHNILHRGVYKGGIERATLHGTVGMVGTENERARVILQHGIGDWAALGSYEDLEGVGDRAEQMRKRLVAMNEKAGGKEKVGFSLDG